MVSVVDPEIERVAEALRSEDPDGVRFARTLRRTYDQIYDGRNTGRYRWEQLRKTEKTHFGSLVEINLQREFSFADGINLDYLIAGVDVDCKWSQTDGQWMLPPEGIGHICLLMTGSDDRAIWSAGLIRAVKRLVSPSDRSIIHWIWMDRRLPENVLLHVNAVDLQAMGIGLSMQRGRCKYLDELFRRVQNRIVSSGAVATVAQQDEPPKLARALRRSRQNLKAEGIVVFGDSLRHRKLALRLGLPTIGDGDSMSAKLIRIDRSSAAAVQLGGKLYRLCTSSEEPATPAPSLATAGSTMFV